MDILTYIILASAALFALYVARFLWNLDESKLSVPAGKSSLEAETERSRRAIKRLQKQARRERGIQREYTLYAVDRYREWLATCEGRLAQGETDVSRRPAWWGWIYRGYEPTHDRLEPGTPEPPMLKLGNVKWTSPRLHV